MTMNWVPALSPTPVSPCPATIFRLHRLDVPSAGTRPGIACSSAPYTTSGIMCPIEDRAYTAAGYTALTIVPGGAVTFTAPSVPALFGTVGATTQLIPNV